MIVDLLAQQLAVDPAIWTELDWDSRTARRHREEVAGFRGFRAFHAANESGLTAHLIPLVTDLNPDSEGLKQQGQTFHRGQRLVPPPVECLARCLCAAVNRQETHWLQGIKRHLSAQSCHALDALISTDAATDDLQRRIEKITSGPDRGQR